MKGTKYLSEIDAIKPKDEEIITVEDSVEGESIDSKHIPNGVIDTKPDMKKGKSKPRKRKTEVEKLQIENWSPPTGKRTQAKSPSTKSNLSTISN
jgi:hypothetical protein